jgi:hypothetical protein
MARAVYRGYWHGGKRSARVTRLHVIREAGKRNPWLETLCGQSATQHTHSEPVIFDPMPPVPPEGLSWCPKCIGHLAERYGLLGVIAESLAAWDPDLYDDPEPRWARRRAARLAGEPS